MTAKASRHKCIWRGCNELLPQPLIYCTRHWQAVPVGLRRRVNRSYRRLGRRPRSRSRAREALALRQMVGAGIWQQTEAA